MEAPLQPNHEDRLELSSWHKGERSNERRRRVNTSRLGRIGKMSVEGFEDNILPTSLRSHQKLITAPRAADAQHICFE